MLLFASSFLSSFSKFDNLNETPDTITKPAANLKLTLIFSKGFSAACTENAFEYNYYMCVCPLFRTGKRVFASWSRTAPEYSGHNVSEIRSSHPQYRKCVKVYVCAFVLSPAREMASSHLGAEPHQDTRVTTLAKKTNSFAPSINTDRQARFKWYMYAKSFTLRSATGSVSVLPWEPWA